MPSPSPRAASPAFGRDVVMFGKAAASNLLARWLPSVYVRLTRQTGRGRGDTDLADTVDYFFRCVGDYAEQLGLDDAGFDATLRGARVLEYGPGDVLGTALLFYARGAAFVQCVDRFALERMSAWNVSVYEGLLARLGGAARARADAAFRIAGQPASGFRDECVRYSVTRDGLAHAGQEYDLVVSRAVLEHVNDLDATLADVAACLKPAGVSVHNVDLKSHHLDRDQPFDFLSWPEWAYRLMYSHKGFPNRCRVDRYRRGAVAARLQLAALVPTAKLPAEAIERLRPRLARPFRAASSEDLRWMGFWIVLRPAPGAAPGAARP